MYYLRQNWAKLLLGLLVLIVLVINFRWGFWILGNDNYSPEENPKVSFERYLVSPTWREYRGLGVPSDSEQIDVFRSGAFYILEKIGIPLWLISQLSVWLAFASGVLGMGWLTEKLYQKKEAFWGGGVIYLSSILTLWLFYSPLKPFIFYWGFLPLFLAMTLKLLEKESIASWLGWILTVILVSQAFIIPTLFFVTLIVLFFVGLMAGFKTGKWKKIFGLGLIFLIWQLYWLIPFGFYVKEQSGQLQDSFINRSITSGTIQDEKEFGGSINILRFITKWVETRNDDGQLLFAFGDWYRSVFGVILGFLSIVLMLLGVSKKKWSWPSLGMAFLGGILLINSNPPFGWLYDWCSNNIPLFKQVFRWGSSKFWAVWWLPVVIVATNGWLKVWRWKKLAGWVIVVGLLVYIYPVFVGRLVSDRDLVKIPSEYFELRDYLEKVDNKGRVYLAPEANMLYFRNHDWGFFGSVFWSYWIPNPIIEKSLITGSRENEEAFQKILNVYYSENPLLFVATLNNAEVKWVIGDKSLSSKGNGYDYDWNVYNASIAKNPYLSKVWSRGKLELYQVSKVRALVDRLDEKNIELVLRDGVVFGEGVETIDNGFLIKNYKAASGVYWTISNPDLGGRLLKILGELENRGGVVGELNLREAKRQNQVWSRLAKMQENEMFGDLVYLPKDWRNYLLEFKVIARGPDKSVNTLRNLRIESVPLNADYLNVRLPESQKWESLKYVTYAGWVINALLVVLLLVRQKLKS